MAYIHTEYFSIRTAEINQRKVIHPHALIQLMQEASMQHTIGMKVSVWDMEALQASWVLLKMEVNIFTYPTLGETVRVDTYPSGLDGYFTYRDYYMYDNNGDLMATTSTMWTMMNTYTRRMLKIPEEFGSLVYPAASFLPRPTKKIKDNITVEKSYLTRVNYLHLDWNGHMNNVQYIKMIMESLDPNILKTKEMRSLVIQYKSEALLGQELAIMHQKDTENIIRHIIRDLHSGRDLIVAETDWSDIL